MIISLDAEKGLDKTKSSHDKSFQDSRNGQELPYTVKEHLQNPSPNITFSGSKFGKKD